MADVVGLRFVTTGEKEAIAAYDRYKAGLLSLGQVQDKHVAAFNRRASEEIRALQRQDTEARKAFQNRLRYDREKEQAAAQAARAVEQAAQQEARAIQRQDAEARKAYQQYLRYQQEKERAAESAAREIEQAAEREARAQQRASASYGQLRAAIDPAYAAQMRMKQAHDVVKQALAQEVITREEAARTLVAYRAQAMQTSAALQGQAGATMFASRAQNASGMAMQQVGYQVGDFLVQVQSGTNAMVAFGQQATQLVGVLPMFGSVLGVSGTALIGLSAGLGIAIPLITAIGATIMRARENAGDAAEAFKGLGASLDALDNVRLDSLNKGIAEGAREAAREYERVLNLMERVELRALQSILQGQSNAVEAMIKNQDTLRNLAAQGGLEFDFEVMGLDTYNEAVFLAAQLRTLNGETREELLQQVTAIEEALTLRGLMNPQVEAMVAKLAEEVGLIEAARDAVEEKNDALGQSTTLADAFRSVMENISIDSLLGQMDSLNSKLGSAIFGAGTMSARLRGLFDAGVAAAENAAYAQQIGGGRSMGRGGPTAEEVQANDPRAQIAYTPGGSAGVPLPKIGGSSGRGGRGAAREQEDYLKNLLLEAQHKQRLVGLTEEQTRRQELLFEMEKRKLPIDEERIAMIVATESYTRSLMEAEEQRMQMMQTVEGHIENAFMSFVDGSATVEEAFKGMLRNILLAVYQQEVAKPAASAVSTLFRGLLGFANGGAFNKGVEFFANGGVVGSPTMFQHSGGLGVMGEAGPEAIMPLKRGANGKLGVQMDGAAGGNVTVNQYFQVSANGDESVRRIVRQEAPRMAEMAKSAVVDAKRRGGTYGRSF